VFGELAYKVTDASALLAKLIGTGAAGDYDAEIATWIKDQTLAAIRAVLPDIVAQHGVLAMGQIQDATSTAALAKANEPLSTYGIAITTFGELNVNLPEADAQQLKQLAATKAYTEVAGSFDSAVRGEAALEIAQGVADGQVGAQPAVVAGMMMGVPVGAGAAPAAPQAAPAAPAAPAATPVPAPATPAPVASAAPQPTAAAAAATSPEQSLQPDPSPHAHFCSQCGTALSSDDRFCPNCGAAVSASGQ